MFPALLSYLNILCAVYLYLNFEAVFNDKQQSWAFVLA